MVKTFTQFSEAYRKVYTKVPHRLNGIRIYRHNRQFEPDVQYNNSGVGPHEYIHRELMDRGLKPASLVTKDEYKKKFHPAVRAGKYIAKRTRKGYYIVGQPGENWRVQKIHRSLAWTKSHVNHMNRNHIRLGRLLGYTKPQIIAFLKGIR